MKLVRTNRYDVGLQTFLRMSEPPRTITVGAEGPPRLRGVDYFLLAFTGAAGFVLGRHLRWEKTR
jgi:hypothetical protein